MTALFAELSRTERAKYARHARALPLEAIRDDAHLDQALAMIDRLLDQGELSSGDEVYLNALADHVIVYEAAHVAFPEASGIEVLRHLMEERGLKQKDLVGVFGSKSTVSAVLAGKRPLALAHIAKLSDYFAVPADVFIDRPPRATSDAPKVSATASANKGGDSRQRNVAETRAGYQ